MSPSELPQLKLWHTATVEEQHMYILNIIIDGAKLVDGSVVHVVQRDSQGSDNREYDIDFRIISTFLPFPRLPVELRLKIWRCALPQVRTVRWGSSQAKDIDKLGRVSHEAKLVFEKHYRPLLVATPIPIHIPESMRLLATRQPQYIDAAADTLSLAYHDLDWIAIYSNQVLDTTHLQNLDIEIEYRWISNTATFARRIVNCVQSFTKLRNLSIVLSEDREAHMTDLNSVSKHKILRVEAVAELLKLQLNNSNNHHSACSVVRMLQFRDLIKTADDVRSLFAKMAAEDTSGLWTNINLKVMMTAGIMGDLSLDCKSEPISVIPRVPKYDNVSFWVIYAKESRDIKRELFQMLFLGFGYVTPCTYDGKFTHKRECEVKEEITEE